MHTFYFIARFFSIDDYMGISCLFTFDIYGAKLFKTDYSDKIGSLHSNNKLIIHLRTSCSNLDNTI